MFPWALCTILAILVLLLLAKIHLMHKSIIEICVCFREHLSTDTNQLIYVQSGDKYVRKLAGEISKQLSILRQQQRKYINGDRELKDAVTNISHDLRTPLTAICGYLELIEREEKSETVSNYLSMIQNRTEALKNMTEELLRYSVIASVSELNCERVNLRSVLEDSLLSFYGEFEKEKIMPEISMEDVYRTLDKSALSRIFNNIISNVVKYSDGDFSVSLAGDGEIIFSNGAKGLSSVDVGKLFDRFYTVDTARRSMGLGLSIAKLLTERMNGSIRAEYKDNALYIMVKF